jgi:hypothetical protein
VLSREGVIGICPRTMPARDKSAADARVIVARLTSARPKFAAFMLVTPLAKRALRYALTMFVLFTIPTLLTLTPPRNPA